MEPFWVDANLLEPCTPGTTNDYLQGKGQDQISGTFQHKHP